MVARIKGDGIMKSVLIDTSFFIRLLDETDPLCENAKMYLKYFLENEIACKISTIAIAEFSAGGDVKKLPWKLLKTVSFDVLHALIGPNGAGKTTLFRLIMGLEKPDSGTFTVGDTVKIAYVDQQHSSIDPEKTVYQVISGGTDDIRLGNKTVNARAYVSKFNFSGSDQEKKCGVLSGGERNRLHLALALKEHANVILLDEPTNDIDVNTLRALEEGLENFAGCAVVVSHDRWFLDRIATHILAFEGDSQVKFFEGSYSEYQENYRKRMGDAIPTRFKYKKLME